MAGLHTLSKACLSDEPGYLSKDATIWYLLPKWLEQGNENKHIIGQEISLKLILGPMLSGLIEQ